MNGLSKDERKIAAYAVELWLSRIPNGENADLVASLCRIKRKLRSVKRGTKRAA